MNNNISYPLLDKDGFIIIDSVNSLSFKNIKNWIKMVLLNNAPGAGAHKEELPSSFLKRIFHQLDPTTREAFQDAVLTHLSQFAQGRENDWSAGSGDELLLLVGAIFRKTKREKDPVDLLLSMGGRPNVEKEKKLNIHWRILQTLVALNYSPPSISFWTDQYRIGDDQYASIVVAGVSIISLSGLFEWIKSNISDNSVIKVLLNRLPLLVERHGIDLISSYMNSILPLIRGEAYKELAETADMLNLKLNYHFKKNIFENWRYDEIASLSNSLNLELPDRQIFPQIVAVDIENQIRKQYKKEQFQEDLPEELKVIFGIIHLAGKYKIGIKKHEREKLIKYVDVYSRLNLIDDFTRTFVVYSLINEGRNIENEMANLNG